MNGEYQVDYEIMGRASDQLTDDITSLSSMGEYITSNLEGMDPRISEYLNSIYKLDEMANRFSDLSLRAGDYQNWMNDAVDTVKTVDADLAGVNTPPPSIVKATPDAPGAVDGSNSDIDLPDINLDTQGTDTEKHEGEDVYINPSEFETLPTETQDDIRSLLKLLGYTDEEIDEILQGKRGLKPGDIDKINEYINEIAETDPALAERLRKIFSIGGNNNDNENHVDDLRTDDNHQNTDTEINERKGNSIGGSLSVLGTNKNGIERLSEEAIASTDSLVNKLGASAKKIASKISPYSGGSNGAIDNKSASAGIIAAAGLAAAGSAAGGGILAGKKLSMIKFTPKDWEALGKDYQGIISKVMKRSGFTEDEIETFKHSTFQIATNELKEHVKKIEKAMVANPECEDDLVKLYNFSMFDDHKRVIDYLLFITMIIDGRNVIDEYNMYNVINQNMEEVDEADFSYSGIVMEEYFCDSDDKEEAPTQLSSIDKLGDEKIELPTEKEWLKGIGIDD